MTMLINRRNYLRSHFFNLEHPNYEFFDKENDDENQSSLQQGNHLKPKVFLKI